MEGPANVPKPFSADDYLARAKRVVASAEEQGLDGVLVTPGPDLVWLTGYQPTAITERLTVLVLARGQEPTLLVPALERPDAEAAQGAKGLALKDWADATDPYVAAADLLHPDGAYGVSDSAWALHLLGLQARLPGSRYRSLTECLPMMRAVKDAEELERLAAAGAAADAAYGEIVTRRFAGRRETEVAADLAALLREFGHEQVDFTVVGSGPNGANPHHEAGDRVIQVGDAVVLDFGGLKYGYGSDTTRTVCVGEPTDEIRKVHEIVRRAQQAGVDAGPPWRVLPGRRPRRPSRHRRRRVRRGVHPPHRARHRRHDARAAIHGRGRGTPTHAGHVLLRRARHLPRRPVRRAHRGHRHRYRGWGTPPQQHRPRAAHRRVIRGGVGHPKQVMRVPRPRKTIDVSDVRRLHRGGIEMRPDHVSTSMSTDGRWAT